MPRAAPPARGLIVEGPASASGSNDGLMKRIDAEARERQSIISLRENAASFSIKPIPSLSPDELDVLDPGNFDEIELMLFDKNIPVSQMNDVFCSLYDRNVSVYSVHLPNFALNRPRSRQIELFEEFAGNVSEIFHPRVMVIHSLYGGLADLVSNLRKLSGKLPGGVILAIENLPRPRANIQTLQSLRQFFEALAPLPENVGFCLDTTHVPTPSASGHTGEIIKFIRAVPEALVHMHISDKRWDSSFGDGDPLGWIQHEPLGKGITDWKRVKMALTGEGYSGRVVLEYGLGAKNLLADGAGLWASL